MTFVGSADLHKAIATVWEDSGISWEFKKNWEESLRTQFTSLNDQDGMAKQPFPYCVYEQEAGNTDSRDSGHSADEKHEHRLVPWIFRIHAKEISTNNETAKETAARLAGFVMQKFGGHPEADPLPIELTYGNVLNVQYQNDVGIKTGDKEYRWDIFYLFLLDVPVKLL